MLRYVWGEITIYWWISMFNMYINFFFKLHVNLVYCLCFMLWVKRKKDELNCYPIMYYYKYLFF